jgi:DDE family transposase
MTRVSRLGPTFETWLRDDPQARAAILQRQDVDIALTSYAQNDFLLEFLMGSGLWEVLVNLRPGKLRKENGKPWRALNGLEVLRELINVKRIAHCGRVISDTRLMVIAGFNAREIRRQRRRQGLLVDPETLSNHLARMTPPGVIDAFYKHVALLRERGFIGRGVYAVDGHEITFPHARGWQGMGKVGEAHGFKLVLLVQVSPGGERVVGFALGPLQVSEHRLLKIILKQLEQRVCPVKKLIDVLVLDRGYWGADFLLGLRKRYGFHFVTRAQHENLSVVKDVEGLMGQTEAAGPAATVAEKRSRLGEIQVRLWGFQDLPLYDEKGRLAGEANVVVADEYDKDGNRLQGPDGELRPRIHYVTSLPTKRDPYGIRKHYLLRWTIENQGFRNLTQRWSLDIPAGRNYRSILARIFFVLILANAESVLEEHFPGPWQEERRRLGKLGVPGLFGGEPGVAAYTDRGQLGLLSVEEYGSLVAQRERESQRADFIRELRQAQARGERIEEILRRLTGKGE